tara:strand:+ start:1050 stop:1595 length:546 start_codon:yes stop_codon:yes gene_type:complete
MLEPIFGSALALNLAYLNLKKFRYRDEISETAKEKIQQTPDEVHDAKWYKVIANLASGKLSWGVFGSLWGILYAVFFHTRLDRGVSIIATVISAYYLALGVAHSVGYKFYYYAVYNSEKIFNELMYGIAFMAWPFIMPAIAWFCIWGSSRFFAYQLDGIKAKEITLGRRDLDEASAEIDEL